ncbi:hypothetical protein QQF64_022708 [Cirrhinus molitorella]|uniref:Uncharacterized protein n=1 Tax=Cirrhinus molitorella TaxID=172907 RepID=A0ABR3L6Q2_9TELE
MGPHRPPTAKGQRWDEEGGGGQGHMRPLETRDWRMRLFVPGLYNGSSSVTDRLLSRLLAFFPSASQQVSFLDPPVCVPSSAESTNIFPLLAVPPTQFVSAWMTLTAPIPK